jgi:hypothetical protein
VKFIKIKDALVKASEVASIRMILDQKDWAGKSIFCIEYQLSHVGFGSVAFDTAEEARREYDRVCKELDAKT